MIVSRASHAVIERKARNLLAIQADGLALWTEAEQNEAGDVIESLLALLSDVLGSPRPEKEREWPCHCAECATDRDTYGPCPKCGSYNITLYKADGSGRHRTASAEVVSPSSLVATTDAEVTDPASRHIFTIRADGPCSVCGRPQKDVIHGT